MLRERLLKAETEYYNAFLHSHSATLDRMMSEDGVWIGPRGMQSKQALLQRLKSKPDAEKERTSKQLRSLSETKVRFFGDMAIINAVETETSTAADVESRTDKTNYTSLWAKRNESWQLLNVQWTLAVAQVRAASTRYRYAK